MTAITFHLKDHDPKGGLDDLAKEDKRDWSVNEVVVKHTATSLAGRIDRMNAIPATGTVQSASNAVVFESAPDVRLDVQSVVRHGPHASPIIWTIRDPKPPSSLAPGASADLTLGARVRISMWANMTSFWDAAKDDIQRARFKGLSGLDDITLLVSVNLKDDTSGELEWADNFLAPNKTTSDARKTLAVARCIQFFHAQKVQVFAGLYMDTGMAANAKYYNRFVKFLKGTSDFTAHAQAVSEFFKQRSLEIDGISYDIEGGSNGTTAMGTADLPKMKLYYETMAAELAKKERYLAFAAGAARSDAQTFVMKEQPFWLASTPNIIVRPMSYNIGKSGRTEMVKYALGSVVPSGRGLHPGQFQVALATSLSGGEDHTHAEIAKELETVHRRFRVGFIHWNLDNHTKAADYALHDAALNPDGPPVGTLGQPLQGPLGPQRIAAFAAAAAAE